MAMNVESKTAIITGAGSGINFCFAALLLSKGCNVVIADLALRPEAEELVQKYSSGSEGAKAIFQKTDVTEWSQLDKVFEVTSKRFGGADIVCPGAGVYEPIAIAHFMNRNKPGVVIHISSVAGQAPSFSTPMYVASKHAISGFVRSLARLEFPTPDIPKVRVSAVAPALIKTPLWTDHPEKIKLIPNDEDVGWVTPEFVAEAMLSLIEKEEYPGGTILEVGKSLRKVTPFNDPGPASGGNSVKRVDQKTLESDIWASLETQHRK